MRSFECICTTGYEPDSKNPACCIASSGKDLLLLGGYKGLFLIRPSSQTVQLSNKSVAAMDFNYKTKQVFWTSVKNEDGGITSSNGLAIDWIYNHLYWTQSWGKPSIKVANYNGRMKRTLIENDLDRPSAIVVDPIEGWMFWTDVGFPHKIERASMDGTKRKKIISDKIAWATDLALDFVQHRLYWIDSNLHMISSSDFDGHNRKLILQSRHFLLSSNTLALYEDWIYWSDRFRKDVYKANKYSGADVTILYRNNYTGVTLQIYHQNKQPEGENYCQTLKYNCSHLCLPAAQSSAKISCACPDNLVLASDRQSCIDSLENNGSRSENGVIILTKENFDDTIVNNSFVFVLFYAQWCHKSKVILTVFEEAAKMFADKESPVKLGKVDIEEEEYLLSRSSIKVIPSLLLYDRPYYPTKYEAKLNSKSIIDWLMKMSTPPFITLHSSDYT